MPQINLFQFWYSICQACALILGQCLIVLVRRGYLEKTRIASSQATSSASSVLISWRLVHCGILVAHCHCAATICWIKPMRIVIATNWKILDMALSTMKTEVPQSGENAFCLVLNCLPAWSSSFCLLFLLLCAGMNHFEYSYILSEPWNKHVFTTMYNYFLYSESVHKLWAKTNISAMDMWRTRS